MTSAKPPNLSSSGPPIAGARGDALARIEAKLDRIEARLAVLDPLLDAGPGLIAMAGDTFDEWARDVGDADERMKKAFALLERMTRPAVLDQLETLLELVESAPGAVAMIGDSFDEFARNAAEHGVELDKVVPEIAKVVEASLKLIGDEHVQQLLASDLLLPEAVEALGQAARALANAQRAPERRLGPLGAFFAMREPEVQRAVGFAIDVARRFGANTEYAALPSSSQGTKQ